MSKIHHVCWAILFLISHLAHAEGGDHPLAGRDEGSEQVGRHVSDFDEVELIEGPISNTRGIGASDWTRVEGKVTLFYYTLPAGRCSQEALRN